MDEVKIIIPRNKPVVVRDDAIMFTTLQEGERLVEQGNFNNCKEPKWDEEIQDFIEGIDPNTLESDLLIQSLIPSQQEVNKAEREIETINLLTELGVII